MIRRLKSALVPALCLGLAAPAVAEPGNRVGVVGPTGPLDGEPTAEACRQFGYMGPEYDPHGRMGATRRAYPMPPPPPPPLPMAPPPPVMAAPAVEADVESIVVTGSRMPQGAVTSGAPVVVPGPVPQADTERYPDATPNPVRVTAEQPVSTFSIDVDTAAYANVRRFLTDGDAPPRDAVRVEELVNYFDYGYAPPASREAPFAVFTELAAAPWADGRQLLHVGLQGYELQSAEQPPLNLVFLVDVSGSMWDETKLPLAQRALNTLIDGLRPQDRVAIAVYAGAAGAILQPTPGDQKLRIRCAVESLRAGGSTAGGAGLALAYRMAEANLREDAVNRVILMTDGDFNVGVTSDQRLEDFVAERRETGVYLSVYGFGRGNYNDRMMQAISQAGNGTAGYIDSLAEARRLFRDDFSGSIFPIADDVKIQVEFNPAHVAEWRLIGYETRLLNREDFNNDAVDAGEVGSGASVTALYEITPVGGPTQVDPLRYAPAAPAGATAGELAFVRVRYKLPGEDDSRLIERPVAARAASTPSEATRWAASVAAFGQLLRADPWLAEGFGWDEVEALAQGARGDDPDGLRAEFVTLVRAAQTVTPRRTP